MTGEKPPSLVASCSMPSKAAPESQRRDGRAVTGAGLQCQSRQLCIWFHGVYFRLRNRICFRGFDPTFTRTGPVPESPGTRRWHRRAGHVVLMPSVKLWGQGH